MRIVECFVAEAMRREKRVPVELRSWLGRTELTAQRAINARVPSAPERLESAAAPAPKLTRIHDGAASFAKHDTPEENGSRDDSEGKFEKIIRCSIGQVQQAGGIRD